MSTTYPISGPAKATVDEIVAGTSNEVFTTPEGLKGAGIHPERPPENAIIIEVGGTFDFDFPSVNSSTGHYLVNGSMDTFAFREGQNWIAPCDNLGSLSPSGVITAFMIANTSGQVETAVDFKRLPEGLTTLNISDTDGLIQFFVPLPSTITSFVVYAAPEFYSLPELPNGLLTLSVSSVGLSSAPTIPPTVTSVYLPSCSFSTAALDSVLVDLGAATPGGTADLSGNPGSATCDPTPATANGWTVTV